MLIFPPGPSLPTNRHVYAGDGVGGESPGRGRGSPKFCRKYGRILHTQWPLGTCVCTLTRGKVVFWWFFRWWWEKLASVCVFGRGYWKSSLFLGSDQPQMGFLFLSAELLGFFRRTSDWPLEALNVFVWLQMFKRVCLQTVIILVFFNSYYDCR